MRRDDPVSSLRWRPARSPSLSLKLATGTVMERRRLMSNAEHIYSIAVDHAQTVQVCIDRLHELGANAQLKLLTGKLQKLAVRATPGDDDTKAARRQRGLRRGGKLITRAASDGARTRGGDRPR